MARNVERYFFVNDRTGKTTTIDNPEAHPGFNGKVKGQPAVLLDGVLQFGRKMMATQNDSVRCTTSCKRATQPFCSCSCGGKNHGIHHKGPKADELDGLI